MIRRFLLALVPLFLVLEALAAGPPAGADPNTIVGNWSVWVNGARVLQWHATVLSSGDRLTVVQMKHDEGYYQLFFDRWVEVTASGNSISGVDARGNSVEGSIREGGKVFSLSSRAGQWEFRRAEPRNLPGWVTDALTKRPIRNATVASYWSSLVTDSNGAFSFTGDEFESEYGGLEVRARNYAPVSYVPDRGSREERIELLPSAPITGRILDEKGKPVSTAHVRVESFEYTPDRRLRIPEELVTSDATGRFRAEHLPAGEYRVSVEAEGFVSKSVDYRKPAARTPKDVVLHPAGRVRISVREDGAQVDDVSAMICSGDMKTGLISFSRGLYEGSVPIGALRVTASSPARGVASVDAIIRRSKMNELVVNLEPAGIVHGRVVDETGRGIRGVAVGIRDAVPAPCSPWAGPAVSGSAGHFQAVNLLTSRATVEIGSSPRGHVAFPDPEPMPHGTPVTIDLPAKDLTLTLYRSGRLEGVLLDAHGRPFDASKRATVFARAIDYSGDNKGTFDAYVHNGKFSGHYELPIRFLYEAEACASGGKSAVSMVRPGSPATLMLLPAGVVTGRIIRDGVPLQGARVDVDYGSKPYVPDYCSGPEVDGSGRFEVLVSGGKGILSVRVSGIGSRQECPDDVFQDVTVEIDGRLDVGDIEVSCDGRASAIPPWERPEPTFTPLLPTPSPTRDPNAPSVEDFDWGDRKNGTSKPR